MAAKSADQYFDVLRELGKGGQGGIVDEVRSKLSFKHYAVRTSFQVPTRSRQKPTSTCQRKRIQRNTSVGRRKDIVKRFENEIKIIKDLSKKHYHQHLVKFVG